MGLTYFYRFRAPATTPQQELESFLEKVGSAAIDLGFKATLLNLTFDDDDRRRLSCRIGGGIGFEDERLKGDVHPRANQVYVHIPSEGAVRLYPERGIITVVTDEHQNETCFGFLRFPDFIRDQSGKVLAETPFGKDWVFQDHMKSPDKRYRFIVALFARAGYLDEERDDFA